MATGGETLVTLWLRDQYYRIHPATDYRPKPNIAADITTLAINRAVFFTEFLSPLCPLSHFLASESPLRRSPTAQIDFPPPNDQMRVTSTTIVAAFVDGNSSFPTGHFPSSQPFSSQSPSAVTQTHSLSSPLLIGTNNSLDRATIVIFR